MPHAGLTELVGREEELEMLLRRWTKAKTGEGQVVLLSGEAGIGKSRLTAALLERLAAEPHTHLRYFCSPQHTDSALHPTIGRIERAAGFTRDDTTQMKLDKLDALLAQNSTSAHDATLFADMLSLPNDGRYPVLELTPQQLGVASFGHRVKLLDAIAALRRDASGKAPSVEAATASSAPNAHPEDRAERRQVTVMFSDLVGSTALSARIDPEDLRVRLARTVSSMSFSRKTASYFPRPRLRSQTTMSMTGAHNRE